MKRSQVSRGAAIVLCALQDMPGWGDDINLVNSLKTVLDFLLKQRQKDYIKNKAGLTGEFTLKFTSNFTYLSAHYEVNSRAFHDR
jgi:hypothetical protein